MEQRNGTGRARKIEIACYARNNYSRSGSRANELWPGTLKSSDHVKDNALPADYITRDAGVARYLCAYIRVMLDHPKLRDVFAWGMVDKFSWLHGFAPRKDGRAQRCCPYGGHYQPLVMPDALAKIFEGASPRLPAA